MLNMLDTQDHLKNFSEEQLVQEMQMPSGSVPQFMVLGEIDRRKRMRAEVQKQQGLMQPTVAQEAVTAAGVPQQGIAQVAQSLAPKTDITQNTGAMNVQAAGLPGQPNQPQRMAGGGVLKLAPGGGLGYAAADPQAVRRAVALGLSQAGPQGTVARLAPEGGPGGPVGVVDRGTMVDGVFVFLQPDGRVVNARTRQPVSPEIARKAREKLQPLSNVSVFDPLRAVSGQVAQGEFDMAPESELDRALNARLATAEAEETAKSEDFFNRMDAEADAEFLANAAIDRKMNEDAGSNQRQLFRANLDRATENRARAAAQQGADAALDYRMGADQPKAQLSQLLQRRPGFRPGDDINVLGYGGQSLEELRGIIADPDATPGEREAARTRLMIAEGVEATLEGAANIPERLADAADSPLVAPVVDAVTDAASLLYRAGNFPIKLAGQGVSLIDPDAGASILDAYSRNEERADALALLGQREEVPPAITDEDRAMAVDVEATPLTPERIEEALGLASIDPTTPPADTPPADTSSGAASGVAASGGGASGGGASGGGASGGDTPAPTSSMDQDKWLALAQAGFTLMSTGDFGKAGQAGLAAYSQYKKAAQDARKLEAELALIDARTAAANRSGRGGSSMGLNVNQALSRGEELMKLGYDELERAGDNADAAEKANALIERGRRLILLASGSSPSSGSPSPGSAGPITLPSAR